MQKWDFLLIAEICVFSLRQYTFFDRGYSIFHTHELTDTHIHNCTARDFMMSPTCMSRGNVQHIGANPQFSTCWGHRLRIIHSVQRLWTLVKHGTAHFKLKCSEKMRIKPHNQTIKTILQKFQNEHLFTLNTISTVVEYKCSTFTCTSTQLFTWWVRKQAQKICWPWKVSYQL